MCEQSTGATTPSAERSSSYADETPEEESGFDAMALGSQSGFQSREGTETEEVVLKVEVLAGI